MVGIIIHATPIGITHKVNGATLHTSYKIATLYRGKERFKVFATASLTGLQFSVQGKKKTGWEPFCQKWAKRFQTWSTKISWGYAWSECGPLHTQVEQEIALLCDRLIIIAAHDRSDELATTKSLGTHFATIGKVHEEVYAREYIKILALAKAGWVRTIRIK